MRLGARATEYVPNAATRIDVLPPAAKHREVRQGHDEQLLRVHRARKRYGMSETIVRRAFLAISIMAAGH